MKPYLFCLMACAGIYSCQNNSNPDNTAEAAATPLINYSVTATHPHDNTLFTEGLLIYKGKLLESTGSSEDL